MAGRAGVGAKQATAPTADRHMTSLKFCVRLLDPIKGQLFQAGSSRFVRYIKMGRSLNQSFAAFLVASWGVLCLAGCSTASDVHTASDSELRSRQNKINRKIAEDDFGLSFGLTRWVSHATEKNKVLKEKEQIDAELLRRRRPANVGITRSPHVAPNVTAFSTHNPPEPPSEGPSTTATSDSQFPTAKRVPNKPGFVFSPSDPSKYVDVSGYPSGSKAKDPYSGKIFTVP
jgi:hypothetical protein